MVERTAMESGEYAHCRPWTHETFNNSAIYFGGEVRLPDLVIMPHVRDGTRYEMHRAVVDSARAAIPTVGVVDTDTNPNLLTYPIPGNDDTIESIQLYLHLFKQAILLGKKYYNEQHE